MTTSTHKTDFSTPSPTEVRAVRTFNAPIELIWAAHMDPDHVRQWLLGPDGWSMPVCEIDARPGGAWRYAWRNDEDGREFGMSGEYLEVDAPRRAVFTEIFEENPPSTNTLELVETDGRTTMTLTMKYITEEVRDIVLATGMTGGMDTSYDRLAARLLTLG
jgi:uncharacterized protein YndB with AHSA1/START domain